MIPIHHFYLYAYPSMICHEHEGKISAHLSSRFLIAPHYNISEIWYSAFPIIKTDGQRLSLLQGFTVFIDYIRKRPSNRSISKLKKGSLGAGGTT
jgi:hypothetical protein